MKFYHRRTVPDYLDLSNPIQAPGLKFLITSTHVGTAISVEQILFWGIGAPVVQNFARWLGRLQMDRWIQPRVGPMRNSILCNWNMQECIYLTSWLSPTSWSRDVPLTHLGSLWKLGRSWSYLRPEATNLGPVSVSGIKVSFYKLFQFTCLPYMWTRKPTSYR